MHQAARPLARGPCCSFTAAAHAVTDGARSLAGPAPDGRHLVVSIRSSTTRPAPTTVTTSTPRTYIGGAANITGAGPQVDITSLTSTVSTAATSYNNARARTAVGHLPEGSSPIFHAAGAITFRPGRHHGRQPGLHHHAQPGFTAVPQQPERRRALPIPERETTGSAPPTTPPCSPPCATAQRAAGRHQRGEQRQRLHRNALRPHGSHLNSTDLAHLTGITDVRTALVLRGNAEACRSRCSPTAWNKPDTPSGGDTRRAASRAGAFWHCLTGAAPLDLPACRT